MKDRHTHSSFHYLQDYNSTSASALNIERQHLLSVFCLPFFSNPIWDFPFLWRKLESWDYPDHTCVQEGGIYYLQWLAFRYRLLGRPISIFHADPKTSAYQYAVSQLFLLRSQPLKLELPTSIWRRIGQLWLQKSIKSSMKLSQLNTRQRSIGPCDTRSSLKEPSEPRLLCASPRLSYLVVIALLPSPPHVLSKWYCLSPFI